MDAETLDRVRTAIRFRRVVRAARLASEAKPQPTPEEIIADAERWAHESWPGSGRDRAHELIQHMRERWLRPK